MTSARKQALTWATLLIFTGIILALLVLLVDFGVIGKLLSDIGLAFIVAGVDSGFRQLVMLRLESEETSTDIAIKLHERLRNTPLIAEGLRLVAKQRSGYEMYYTWTKIPEPQILFFAGRSVLHLMNRDFRLRKMASVEKLLANKLKGGSDIRVLFLDPRSDIIERLVEQEGHLLTAMLADIAVSIGICKRLYELIKDDQLDPGARLHIRLYDEIPYFAYHRVDDDIVVGLHFSSSSVTSAAFSTQDEQIKSLFNNHFMSVFDRAADKVLLEYSAQRASLPVYFNTSLYDDLLLLLREQLGKEQTDALIG